MSRGQFWMDMGDVISESDVRHPAVIAPESCRFIAPRNAIFTGITWVRELWSWHGNEGDAINK